MSQQRSESSSCHLIVLSFNHQQLALPELRQYLFEQDELDQFLINLKKRCHIDDVVGLCTCNRVEIFIVTSSVREGMTAALQALAERNHIAVEDLFSILTVKVDSNAVTHLARLASGLESMVVGDGQILGQLKQAYQKANADNKAHRVTHILFQKAFSIAKRVRNETGLGKGRVSVSALAVEFAKEHFGSMHDIRAAVVGAGKMSSLAARYLFQAGVKELRIVNRTYETAQELAQQVNATVYGLDELDRALQGCDLVISGTAATEPVITPELFQSERLQGQAPRMAIDIALPPDIDPAVAEIEGVEVVSLEDLRACAEKNQAGRESELERAEDIVMDELKQLGPWPQPIQLDQIAKDLGDYADRIYQEELEGLCALVPDLTPEQQEVIAARMKRMAERIVLAPRRNMRRGETIKSCPEAVKCLAEVFREASGARSLPTVTLEP
ncbi:glutamyl-tRNA reductase, partial [bacterium]|nr:glutamyl-tRNA reductase [bacterium]